MPTGTFTLCVGKHVDDKDFVCTAFESPASSDSSVDQHCVLHDDEIMNGGGVKTAGYFHTLYERVRGGYGDDIIVYA